MKSGFPKSYKAVPEGSDLSSGELAASLGLPWRGTGMPRLVIGRREWIALPDLGISPLNAKTDTGARSSSIHAEEVVLSADRKTVSFTTLNHRRERIHCQTQVAKLGRVRSSNGIGTRRIFIQTRALFPGGLQRNILLSLADRSEMLCPLLLGRRALSGYFLIDPQASYLLGSF